MQRDYWYTSGLSPDDLESPLQVGRRAAERTVARLDPRPIRTGEHPGLFAPAMALTVWMLAVIPRPTPEDEAARTKREGDV